MPLPPVARGRLGEWRGIRARRSEFSLSGSTSISSSAGYVLLLPGSQIYKEYKVSVNADT